MSPLLANLNPEQRAAVEATEGPLLILAGAGSGKTRVITSRIAWLIQQKNVAPDSILAVTFTNKAAAEMGERVEKLLGHASIAKPLIATFHSLCVRILRRDIEVLKVNGSGLTRDFAIYDENDQQGIVKQVMRRMGLDTKQLTPRTVLSRISWAKNHMVDPQDYYLESKDPQSERIAHIYKGYKDELRKNNALDFDDLLLEAVRVLKVSAEVRERYQRRYRYLLVDEYQDTNRPQYELMKLLAGEHKNVCAVGDEDQSIYSWRGADIRNILEFEQDFPNAQIIRLEQNYRSTQIILEAAGAVVSNNLRRKGKKLWTDRQGGSLIGYYEAPDGENEALFIADRIQKFLREAAGSGSETHCAVLYRTNSQSRLVEEALRRYGISYTMVGGFSFYERAEIKDLLCYLRLVRNPHDSMALQRVINTPARGIGATTLATLERLALETGTSTWEAIAAALKNRLIPTRALMALDSFRQLLLDAQAMMDPDFAGKLSADVAAPAASQETGDTDFSFGAATAEPAADADFSFGANDAAPGDTAQMSLLDASHFSPFAPASKKQPFLKPPKKTSDESRAPQAQSTPQKHNADSNDQIVVTVDEKTWRLDPSLYPAFEQLLEKVKFRALGIGGAEPQVEITESHPRKVVITTQPLTVDAWELMAVLHRTGEGDYIEKFEDALISGEVEEKLKMGCDLCRKKLLRNETYLFRNQSGDWKQVGSDCLEKAFGQSIRIWHVTDRDARNFRSSARRELQAFLERRVPLATPSESESTAQPADQLIQNTEGHVEGFRSTGDAATLPELIRFIIDRTGYIKALETEGSPEAFSRIENLKELANAAHDAEVRGETLAEFLDHAALASDTDQFDPDARVTLMTLHAAKGLEFPLVFLAGMEEGLFPHSRTIMDPEGLEEERRLCYVGMTRAMNTLFLTRARYRRRYGNDAPESSIPSRFLEEVPPALMENLSPRAPAWSSSGNDFEFGSRAGRDSSGDYTSRHYNYEDESQERPHVAGAYSNPRHNSPPKSKSAGAPPQQPDSIDNIARFFGGGKPSGAFKRPHMDVPVPNGAAGLQKGQRVRHSKYGDGTVLMREGDGEQTKLTVMFPRHGIKKLMEKFAHLERI